MHWRKDRDTGVAQKSCPFAYAALVGPIPPLIYLFLGMYK